ncbi:MAG: SAM-dependent chlorinase/fluorinase [Chloroflexi bacterium]|nr:SAM-dependent chlorinase/fluorinase [Chloroflexota bacterium]
MEAAGIITITTDFGIKDANVAAMKGVILGINPQARILDLSHEIAPQNIAEAAYVLRRGYSYFPSGTVHVVVVDPGVGSERRGLAILIGEYYFVGPDNGVFTYVLRDSSSDPQRRIIHLTEPRFWRRRIAPTFHGRDIFAPVAAHLSGGISIEGLGQEITDPVTLPFPQVRKEQGRIIGHILYIDRFGNLLTDIAEEDLLALESQIRIEIASKEIRELSPTFSAGQAGEIIAYIDSAWHLAIAQVEGNAAQSLGAKIGDEIKVLPG